MNHIILFEPQPRVTQADQKRLGAHLTGWNKVCALLKDPNVSEDDLKRLVVIEFNQKKRAPIIQKLLGRLNGSQRKRIIKALKPITQ